MIRRSPCEYYIKYLLTHPDGYSDTAVGDILRLKQLDYVSPDYIDRLRKGMRMPRPFYPSNRLHSPSTRFLTRHHIYELFHPSEPMERALNVLEYGRAKEHMEALVLAGESPTLVSHRLRGIGFRCDVRVVELYCHHFWNLKLLDSTEIRALLRLRVDYIPEMEDTSSIQSRLAVKKSYYNDPRRIAAEAPMTPLSGLMVQLQMGYMPGQVELARMADAARKAAIGQVHKATYVGGDHNASAARDWAMVGNMMTQLIQDIGSPDEELQKDLQQLALKTEDRAVPHIKQLSDGSHTVDLQPTGEGDVSTEFASRADSDSE